MDDVLLFRRVFELAAKGLGAVSPNPLVGSVIVKNGRIIGEGYHQHFGGPHAEIEALRNCTESPAGATLYINLEPCSHFGKTPPCAPEIVKSGISTVRCCIPDPNPLVSGKGFGILKENGVEVHTGFFEEEAMELNKFFLKYIKTGIPYITVKMAQTIDGRIADSTGTSRWITGVDARNMVHSLRTQYDAVGVGKGTLIADDPLLSVRDAEGREPVKVIFTRSLDIPDERRVFTKTQPGVILFTLADVTGNITNKLTAKGVEVVSFAGCDKQDFLLKSLEYLGSKNISSLLLEGGSILAGEFIRQKLADNLLIFTAPKIIGNGYSSFTTEGTLDSARQFSIHSVSRTGDDLLTEYRPLHN